MYRAIKIFRNLSFLLIILLFTTNETYSNLLRVPDQYETIQSAIDSSIVGDTVLISPGTYYEQLLINEHGLTLAGEFIFDEDSLTIVETIISGDNSYRPLTIISTGDDPVNIVGISIVEGFMTGGGENKGGGVRADSCLLNISYCLIKDNNAQYTAGIWTHESEVFVNYSLFMANSSPGEAGGLLCLYCSSILVEDNLFVDNSGGAGGGMVSKESPGTIRRNKFLNNSSSMTGGGLSIGSGNIVIRDNDFIENTAESTGAGLFVWSNDTSFQATIPIEENRFIRNVAGTIEDDHIGMGGGLAVLENSQHVDIEDNLFYENQAFSLGGAMYICDTVSVHDNLFIRNTSPRASVIYAVGVNDERPVVNVTSNIIYGNTPNDFENDIYYGAIISRQSGTLYVTGNDFYNNPTFAAGMLQDNRNNGILLISDNYWGHPSGAYHSDDNPMGRGDSVDSRLEIFPYSSAPINDFLPIEALTLESPADSLMTNQSPIIFTWNPAVFRDGEFEISYSFELVPEDDDPIIYNAGTDTFLTLENLELEIDYRWTVYVELDTLPAVYANEMRHLFFFDERYTPQPFNLISPDNEADLNDSSMQFSWTTAHDMTTDEQVNYRVELGLYAEFLEYETHESGLDTSIELSGEIIDDFSFWRVRAVDLEGHQTYSTEIRSFHYTAVNQPSFRKIPDTWEISSVYPNPFNKMVQITIGTPEPTFLTIEVYDLLGRNVATLADNEVSLGYHRYSWIANGSTGVYLLKAYSGSGWGETRKLLMIK
ncbi:MAG: T9SS type A sorting domain-containing protein [Candidatus Electryonea clarkiae]|nr:T9SS type A sorting domain-containing protein [Candidatus Electryonea clarkiae]MDP8288236.1 T9SS type A sorting domain-containing protein [Candidatus Electryonea clarkiae]